jgi:hypothetical protein
MGWFHEMVVRILASTVEFEVEVVVEKWRLPVEEVVRNEEGDLKRCSTAPPNG